MNDPWIPDENPEPRPICALRPPWGVWSGPTFATAPPRKRTAPTDPAWLLNRAARSAYGGSVLPPARTADRCALSGMEQAALILAVQAHFRATVAELSAILAIPKSTIEHWRYGNSRMSQVAVARLRGLLEDRDATT